MSTEHPTSHAAEGDSAFVDRLRALGLARKAPTPSASTAAKPAPAASPADPFGRAARKLEGGPYGALAEIPPPIGVTRAAGPIVRHFRVLSPKMQTRVVNGAIRRPDPTA